MKTIPKPWGQEIWWAQNDHYVGKILDIRAGHRTSLQYHKKKHETILVLDGHLLLTRGGIRHVIMPGASFTIEPGVIHRLEAHKDDVHLIEVSTPQVDDVVRLEDDYERQVESYCWGWHKFENGVCVHCRHTRYEILKPSLINLCWIALVAIWISFFIIAKRNQSKTSNNDVPDDYRDAVSSFTIESTPPDCVRLHEAYSTPPCGSSQ